MGQTFINAVSNVVGVAVGIFIVLLVIGLARMWAKRWSPRKLLLSADDVRYNGYTFFPNKAYCYKVGLMTSIVMRLEKPNVVSITIGDCTRRLSLKRKRNREIVKMLYDKVDEKDKQKLVLI